MTALAFDEYVAAIRTETAAMLAAATRAGLGARVPSCPDWDVAGLLEHIGGVHRWATATVAAGAADSPAGMEIVAPPPADRPDWVEAGAAALVDALTTAGPSAPAWSWTGDRTAGFWARRQAHETAVHRVDAELAAGAVTPVPASLAADGIDELFTMMAPRPVEPATVAATGTMHVHRTDGDGEWLVRLTDEGIVVAREHAKGDVAVRGGASDLLLFLYNRASDEPLEVFGDVAQAQRWRDLLRH